MTPRSRLPVLAARELRTFARASLAGRAARRRQLRYYGFRLAERFTPVLGVESDGLRFVMSTHDLNIGMTLFVDGEFEQDELRAVLDVLGRLGRHPFAGGERTFVDVGANIGTAVIPAIARHGAHGGVAFEPDPENCALLRQNLVANGLGDRVAVVEAAVSDRSGEVQLEHAQTNWGDHRVRVGAPPAENAYGEASRSVTRVPAVTLDDQVAAGVLDLERVGLVWVDTQGHEGQVLAGAARLRATAIPVVVEYWPYGLRAAQGLEAFRAAVAESYEHVVDLRAPLAGERVDLRPAGAVEAIDATLDGPTGHTNLLLLS